MNNAHDFKAALDALLKVEWCEASCDGYVGAGYDEEESSHFLGDHIGAIKAALQAQIEAPDDAREAVEVQTVFAMNAQETLLRGYRESLGEYLNRMYVNGVKVLKEKEND